MPTLSLNVPNFGNLLAADDFGHLLEVCRAADTAGVDRLILTDHVVMGPDTSAYSWGAFPTDPDAPWLEPMTVLALVAGQTERIRLGTGIVIAALRGGAVLAKTAATLDLLSGGRVDLGVGTGWQAKEYEAVGLDFAKRGPLLDDTLAVCRALWEGAPAAVARPGITFDDAHCSPRPAAGRRIPIWVSGTLSKAVVRRLTTWGDGWIPIMGATDDDLGVGIERLRGAFADAGRDPAELQVRGRLTVARTDSGAVDLPATLANAAAQARLGVTDVSVALQALDADPDAATAVLPDLVAAFRAEFD
ncbi:TIGR03619 family F420-dependent LLM class oxidoreductase [Rhodococcus oryzae]|uniref:TIGR03619 family F420-dependent LLM class oxidoreductase n=1 Tax=Rhodococcus oryzae TaxID=2571143 RepID=A0ABY2RGP1_9NOCA|nr:TIGR03619 family F420-dependent LLM class oxidoreductase [Rhodococcus oryzae]TJZ75871.1 TIGR03619 family F420-dependent LLM class oxidoreductase [Rhodococcus oryzae]